MRRLLLLVAVAVIALAGCGTSEGSGATTTTAAGNPSDGPEPTEAPEPTGGQDDPPMADEYEAAVVEQLTTTEEGELTIPQDGAECVAPVWVEAMTVERLEEEMITIEELSDPAFSPGDYSFGEDAGYTMVGAFADCDVDLIPLLIESIAGSDAGLKSCLQENLDGEALLDLLARDVGGEDTDEEFATMLDPVEETCDIGS